MQGGYHPNATTDPYGYGFSPQSNGGQTPVPFMPTPSPDNGQPPMTVDGINAFFSSAPTQFIGQQFVQGGQQYVQRFQEKIGVLSGSVLNYHFAVNNDYVRKKLNVLLMPYLRKWNFTRLPEQIPGGPRFRAPRADVNCPDLYIPAMAFCTYCVLGCFKEFAFNQFSTDVMYSKVSQGCFGWFVHILLFKILTYMMSISSTMSFVESICYTGYMFVLLAIQLMGNIVQVAYLSFGSYFYASLCMAIFLVRSLKRVLYLEARHYGGGGSRYNYLLLCLAVFQFVLFYLMG